ASETPVTKVAPFMIHMPAAPSVFCHRMSESALPLNLPVPTMCQEGLALPSGLALTMFVPFIIQMPGAPSVFCHRMSSLPSPLKSPIPTTCQDAETEKSTLVCGIVPVELVQIVPCPLVLFCQTISS